MRNYEDMSTEELIRLLGYPFQDTDYGRSQAILQLQQQDADTQEEKRDLQQEATEDQYYRLDDQYEDTKDSIEDSSVLTPAEMDRRLLDLESLKGTSQITGFGSVQELGVPRTSGSALEQPRVMTGFELFYEPLLRTTSVGPTVGFEDQPAGANLQYNFESNLSQAAKDMEPAERRGFVAAGVKVLQDVMAENPNMPTSEQYDLAVETIEEIDRARNISPEEAAAIDPQYSPSVKRDMSDLELTADALDVQYYTGTDLPMYSQKQFDYFKTAQNAMYGEEIDTQLQLLENPQTRDDQYLNNLQFDMGKGIFLTVPVEILEYIDSNPLGGRVYDSQTDLELLRKYKERDFKNTATLMNIKGNRKSREALARVRAYNELGNPDWKKSQEKRQVVLDNIREFDSQGWIQTETAIGGTSDSTTSWLLRSALAPSGAFAALAYEGLDEVVGSVIGLGFEAAEAVGLAGEADYIGEAGFTGVREEAQVPKYKGYGVAGRVAENIALAKGFTGEADTVADSLNLDTAYTSGAVSDLNAASIALLDTVIRTGGAFMDVSIDPSIDAMIAAPKAFNAGRKAFQAHKAIHGAGSWQQSMKAIAQTGAAEMDLLQGSMSLANKYNTRIPKGITPDDLSVTMANNVADNLQAVRILEKGGGKLDLIDAALENTNVAKSLEKTPTDSRKVIRDFYGEIQNNPKTRQILEEYQQTEDLLQIIKGTDDPTQKALTYAKRSNDLPKADIKQAKRAIAASNEGIGAPTQNLARIYGRNMFYSIAPKLASVENLQWLTRKTLAVKGARDKIIAKASQIKSSKVMNKVLEHDEGATATFARQNRKTGTDILGQGVTVKPTETVDAYVLTGMDIEDIEEIANVVESLELPTRLREEILKDLKDESILFKDDYMEIRNALLDRVARVYEEGVSIADLNRLEGEAQQRMLEAQGTVYRDKTGVVREGLSSTASSALEGILDTTVGAKVSGKFSPETIDKAFNALGRPVVNNSKSVGVELRRVFQEHNKSMATLGFRTQNRFQDLVGGNAEIISRYVDSIGAPETLTGSQAIGLMTVGEKSIGVGKNEQINNLTTSLKWLVDNMFLKSTDRIPLSYSQMNRATGLGEVTTPTIWNSDGVEYINQQLEAISKNIVNDPLVYWDEVQNLMEDLNDAIQNPNNRNRSYTIKTASGVETKTAPIVDDNITSKNVDSLDNLQVNKRFGLIGLSTYYVSESNRIMARVLSESLQKDFKALAIEDITSAPISQTSFEESVQEAAKLIYDNNNVKRSEQDMFNLLKEMVKESHKQDVIRNLDTTINVDRLDDEIIRELRTGQSSLNKSASLAYKATSKEMTANIRAELKLITEENVVKRDDAMKQFDRDKASSMRVEKIELDEKFEADLERIPENKRKNPVLVEIRDDKTKKLGQIAAKKSALKKQITKQKTKGKITKEEAAAARDKVDAKAEQQEAKLRKQAEEKIKAEKGKHEKYAEDSEEVRKLKTAHAKATNDLNKPYVRPRKEYRDQVVNELNNEVLVRKQQLFAERKQTLDSIMGAKSGKEDILEAKQDLARLETIEQKIQYLKQNSTEYNDEFDKILEKIEEAKMSDEDLVEATDQVQNYAMSVLRNNNYSWELTRGDYTSIEDGIDKLFNKNEGFARAMFGDDTYDQLKNELLTKTKAQRQRIIIEALNKNPDVADGLQHVLDLTNEAFYISVLGLNVGSHMRNTISAPAIVYQTTGKILTPKLVSDGRDVVSFGGRIGSAKYGSVAVRTVDGRIYTNADLFNILQESGVKSQFQFLQSEMGRGGKLIRQIDGMKDKNLSDWSSGWLKRTGRAMAAAPRATIEVQTYEDMVFRASVLVDALREGRSVEEAAALARRSMFDYSDIDPGLNKMLRAAFVFTSFRIQNLKEFYRALGNPDKLGRYLKILRSVRTTNALIRSNNQNKQLPYQMYYPQFAQNRIVFEINHYNDRVAFGMAPSIPAIDSMTEMIGYLSLLPQAAEGLTGLPVGLEAKDIDIRETITGQLSPLVKEIVSPSSKYESSKAKPEIVKLFQTVYSAQTPSEIAQMLERFAGGRIKITRAEPGDKNAVDGYIYTLNAKQRQELYHGSLWTMLTILGTSNLVTNYYRLTDPEGTTWQSLDGFQRSLAYLGLYSVSEAKNVEVQQTQRMRGIISEMKRLENTMENLEEDLD